MTIKNLDYFDHEALRFGMALEQGSIAWDVGCGNGSQAMRLAMIGLKVSAVGEIDIRERIIAFRRLFPDTDITFLSGSIHYGTSREFLGPLSLFCSRIFLSGLMFSDSVRLLSNFAQAAADSARFFITMPGIEGNLGNNYPGKDQALEDRMAPLSVAARGASGITGPVCLYSYNDMLKFCHLTGLSILSISDLENDEYQAVLVKSE